MASLNAEQKKRDLRLAIWESPASCGFFYFCYTVLIIKYSSFLGGQSDWIANSFQNAVIFRRHWNRQKTWKRRWFQGSLVAEVFEINGVMSHSPFFLEKFISLLIVYGLLIGFVSSGHLKKPAKHPTWNFGHHSPIKTTRAFFQRFHYVESLNHKCSPRIQEDFPKKNVLGVRMPTFSPSDLVFQKENLFQTVSSNSNFIRN